MKPQFITTHTHVIAGREFLPDSLSAMEESNLTGSEVVKNEVASGKAWSDKLGNLAVTNTQITIH